MEISPIQPVSFAAPAPPTVTPQEAAQRRELIQAVKAVNSSEVLGEHNELVFVVDSANRRAIVRLVDRKTHEVVLQIPPEYVLRLAEDVNRKF